MKSLSMAKKEAKHISFYNRTDFPIFLFTLSHYVRQNSIISAALICFVYEQMTIGITVL